MPSASPKSSMSPGELATCEDFLDGHREYALDLLSNIEKIRRCHRADGCPESREGRTCTLCELCSVDGLLGAATRALVSYDDAETRLQQVRASLRKSVRGRGVTNRETLFKSDLAKTVFLCIVTAGEGLRSQHATWQARLQSEVETSPSPAQSPQRIHTGPGDVDKNKNGDVLLPTYSGPKFVAPETHLKRTAVSTSRLVSSETTSNSSTFVIFRRGLSSDCPCEANRASVASNTSSRDVFGSQVASMAPPSPSGSKKTRTSKVATKSDVVTRGDGKPTAWSTTTSLERHSRGARSASGTPAKVGTNANTEKSSMYDDLNGSDTRALDAQMPQDVTLGGREPSIPTPAETASLTQDTESSSSSPERNALIVDPRVFRLRAQVARSDDACRALMEWCQAWRTKLSVHLWERRGTGLGTSPTHEATIKGTRGCPSALTLDLETVQPVKALSMAGQVEAVTKGLSHDDDETMAQELQFGSCEQEELKGRWLTARQWGRKARKRRSVPV